MVYWYDPHIGNPVAIWYNRVEPLSGQFRFDT